MAMADSKKIKRKIELIGLHDHVCLLYKDLQEQMKVVLPFIEIGLNRKEKCIYIVDEHAVDYIVGILDLGEIETASFLASGQLVIVDQRQSYLRDGRFDADSMIEFLGAATAKAAEEGFAALRITSEMTWALGGRPGVERLVEYEEKLDAFLPLNNALAMCQYNMSSFPAAMLVDVVQAHPKIAAGNVVADNPDYVSPSELQRLSGEHRLERVLKKIAESEVAGEAIERAASEDGLTHLPNKRLFIEFLKKYLANANRTHQMAAVILLGLDEFRQINENFGPEAGDDLLKEAAKRLVACVRTSDVVGRTSADEFSAVLPNVDGVSGSIQAAGKILTALRKPYTLKTRQIKTSASMGISVYPIDGEDTDTLIKKALYALITAQMHGRDRYLFYRDIEEAA